MVVKREIELSRQSMNPMEGKGDARATGTTAPNQLVLYSSTQTPHIVRIGIARFLGLREEQVRVIAPDVGGGFGYKCIVLPEELCVAWLALRYRKPFRYIEDRREHLVAGANSRQHHYDLTAYASEEGRLLALDAEVTIDGGAYSNWPFTIGLEPGQATGNLPGPYDFRGYRVQDLLRGDQQAGLPALPRRRAHRRVLRDGADDRRDRARGRPRPLRGAPENLVRPEQMPYDNVANKHYDSGDYPRALQMAREKLDVDTWRERQKRGEPDGRIIGIGFASYCEQSAHGTSVFAAWGLPMTPGYDQAAVRLTPDGGLEVRVGVHSHGQGMETTLAQLAHEVLGIDVARIQVVHGDTGTTPFSTGTYASRSIVMSGGAVIERLQGADAALRRASARTCCKCAEAECALRARRGRRPGGKRERSPRSREAWYLRPDRLPHDVDRRGLETSLGFKPKVDTGAFSYASHAVAVAVDTDTGQVEILDYVIVEDCGTLVNPMVVEGQTHRRRRAGHRHRDVRGAAVRRQRPAQRFDARRLPAARADRGSRDPHLPPRDAVALHRVRHQGHGRGRRDRAAGGDLQRGERRARAARRRGARRRRSRRRSCSRRSSGQERESRTEAGGRMKAGRVRLRAAERRRAKR